MPFETFLFLTHHLRDSPPSSVMTTTMVSGPSPSGLKTRRDTRYCVYVFSPVRVYSCNGKKRDTWGNGIIRVHSELWSQRHARGQKKTARHFGQMTSRLSPGKYTHIYVSRCLETEWDFNMNPQALSVSEKAATRRGLH